MKINKFKLFRLLLISVIIALTPFANLNSSKIKTVYANSINNSETKDEINKLDKKVYYDGSIEDNFTNDTVIIVLNEEETHKFKTYTPKDFSEIDCVSVTDLTA